MQTEQLNRVTNNIRGHIEAFIKDRLADGQTQFRMQDLHEYIRRNARVAPGSPDRVLRQLRKQGVINYVVVDRAASQYQIIPMVPATEQQ